MFEAWLQRGELDTPRWMVLQKFSAQLVLDSFSYKSDDAFGAPQLNFCNNLAEKEDGSRAVQSIAAQNRTQEYNLLMHTPSRIFIESPDARNLNHAKRIQTVSH